MTFPDDPRGLKVWMGFGYSTADDPTTVDFEQISPSLDGLDDPGPVQGIVRIERGRPGDAPETAPTKITYGLRNIREDGTRGEFSPRNVSGPRYGTLRKGTPTQVTVDIGSGDEVLGTAFVPDFSPVTDGGGINPRVPINALGILATIGRDQESLSSIGHAALAAATRSAVRAYWPLEDNLLAQRAGSAVSAGQPMTVTGTITFGQDEGLPGARATPDMSAGALVGTVSPPGSSSAWFVEFWVKANYSGGSRAGTIVTDSPDVETWGLRQPASASGNIDVAIFDSAGIPAAVVQGPVTDWSEGVWHHIAVTAEQSGSNVVVRIYGDGAILVQDIVSSVTLGAVTAFTANDPDEPADLLSVAHIVVGDGTTFTDSYTAGEAYDGEQAAVRIERLCLQAGAGVDVPNIVSAPMGPQPVGTKLGLLRECELVDHGVLGERRDGRIGYDQLASRYNAPVALTLSYGTEEDPGVVAELIPGDDDRDVANLVTVTNTNTGFSATSDQPTGPVGTNTAEGIGVRPYPVQLNLYDDDQVPHHAGWLLRAGTIDKPRYVVVLNPHSIESIRTALLAMGDGARIQIPDVPPEDHGPDGLDLIIEGEIIEIGADRWMWWLFCEPFEPYAVQVWADESAPDLLETMGRWAEEIGTKLDGAIGEDDVTFDVDAAGGAWTTDANHFDTSLYPPLIVEVGGERMRVTDIADAGGGIYTFTVVRSVNGVHKGHADESPLSIVRPLTWAL